ncbi:cytochrome c [Aestuariicoccus sp. MJ-SS9]|uniref:c-type cytochrome n=1 Tax=Aestuariicoccus sp. MJ-SS9 TaxID=3079855 RepID=UPI00290FD0F6|nr:cytochrome c [Aestuariicoccus sp. MJ-SS9]MDU8912253.1 cytochrome c [Aestuariicoccus sp. MJ-SS9]
MNTYLRAAVAAVFLTITGVAVFAHSSATGVVKERMDAMKAMGDATKTVGAMFSGEVAYDPNQVRNAAEIVQAHSGSAMTDLFPEGSNATPSEAMDTTWEEWETFSALARQLEVMAAGLGRAAGNEPSSTPMGSGTMMSDTGGMMGGSSGMMGGSGMMATTVPMMDAEHLAEMPAEAVFTMMSQTCSACHTRFRAEED